MLKVNEMNSVRGKSNDTTYEISLEKRVKEIPSLRDGSLCSQQGTRLVFATKDEAISYLESINFSLSTETSGCYIKGNFVKLPLYQSSDSFEGHYMSNDMFFADSDYKAQVIIREVKDVVTASFVKENLNKNKIKEMLNTAEEIGSCEDIFIINKYTSLEIELKNEFAEYICSLMNVDVFEKAIIVYEVHNSSHTCTYNEFVFDFEDSCVYEIEKMFFSENGAREYEADEMVYANSNFNVNGNFVNYHYKFKNSKYIVSLDGINIVEINNKDNKYINDVIEFFLNNAEK